MPSAAKAGAWSAEKQTIGSIAYGERDDRSFVEADLYQERQVAPRWGIVSQTHADISADYDPAGWRGEGLVGLKWSPVMPVNGAVAVQAGLTWTYEPSAACDGTGGEIRALAGRAWGNMFVNAEGAYRLRGSGCNHGRFDLTAGWRAGARWLILGQAFVDRDLSIGERGRQTEKVQLSATRFTDAGHGLQAGFRHGLGRDGGEMALVLGWWSAR
ncbi:MAG TPA: hypothetical protein VG735_09020 [Caulobacterales bacterium]|jgi:hypothetical protein|nr:hypothetical protein [Caulobacterales bacterium]